MELSERQKDLFEFVKDQHGDQVRKYTNDPYWTHLIAVAELTNKYVKDFGAIEIALCHDLLEDTKCNWDQLHEALEALGYTHLEATKIADGVHYLTDQFTKERYPDFNRKARKGMECQRLATIPSLCQSIKYADLIDNSKSIVEHDHGFAKVYLNEKMEILKVMGKGNFDLLAECCDVLQKSTYFLK